MTHINFPHKLAANIVVLSTLYREKAMEIETLRTVLGWAAIINLAVMLFWWVMLTVAKDWMFKMHRHWFGLTDVKFNEIHYLLFGQYKLANFLLFIAPYLALRIIG